MTTTLHHAPPEAPAEPMELFRIMLEDEFAAETTRLTQLTVCARRPRHGGYDPRILDGLITSARQRIAATAHALRRMSEGTYGVCATCDKPIPLGRLHIAPTAAHCARCAPARDRS
ncbi:dksA/traR C4-type zinc finger [Paractinoplanes atraurantiacus]|uniref:DksA/traR C4-type zinc finger n=1 Tax=Paractinoplanes atraurantiacus TaxID=1036182 RepID=A0A285GN26_9ACTN|nr:dksA/traR C4-type zinc finger [Actinoplanes atraurantiacus]